MAPRGVEAADLGPAGDDCPPPDSLEWLIEAAASIGTVMAHRGAVLRTVTDTGELVPTTGRGRLSSDDLLDRLAAVSASRVSSLRHGIEQLGRAAGEGPVVCLLGAVGPDDVVDLIRARSGPTRDYAVLADVATWVGPVPGRGRRGYSAASRETLDRQREDAASLLRAAGWGVAIARSDLSVAQVWASLGGPGATASADVAPGAGAVGVPA
jgi:hypothetical protein